MRTTKVIVLDTWRQSRQQGVFIIMIGLLALVAIAFGVLLGTVTDEQGRERTTIAFQKKPAEALEQAWLQNNASIRLASGDIDFGGDPARVKAELERVKAEIDAEAAHTSLLRQGVEAWLFTFAGLVYSLSMLLFIGACAGYFPNMLESGGIDLVLAKPLNRLRIYLGKYLGGLALYAAAVLGAYLIVFAIIGVRTGVWHSGVFLAMPLQIFSAAVLYAILALVGVLSRSSTLALVVGLVFYMVIDSIVAALLVSTRMGLLGEFPTLKTVGEVVESSVPNFAILKQHGTACVLTLPDVEAKPFVVAFAWLLGTFGLGYWKFSRTDY